MVSCGPIGSACSSSSGAAELFRAMGILLVVSVCGGIVCGASIGFVPVYLVLQADIVNCDGYGAAGRCQSAPASCEWVTLDRAAGTTTAFCAFPDEAQRVLALQRASRLSNGTALRCSDADTQATCSSVLPSCHWNDGACSHVHGFDASETGTFAATLLIGAIFGSAIASVLWARLGRYLAAVFLGGVVVVGTGACMAGVALDSFALLVSSRVVVGIGMGLAHVVVPLVVNEGIPPASRGGASAVFQAAFQLGIAIPATVGAAVAPQRPLPPASAMRGIAYGLLSVPLAAAGTLMTVGLLLHSRSVSAASSKSPRRGALETNSDDVVEANETRAGASPPAASWATLLRALRQPSFRRAAGVAVVLAAAQQLSGINAVMTYAPIITHDTLGLDSLAGSCLIAWWNLGWTFISIPIARRLATRPLYLGALAVVTVSLTLVGVSALAFGERTAGKAVAGAGLAVFIAAFEIGMGSLFWTLAAEVFVTRASSMDAAGLLLDASDLELDAHKDDATVHEDATALKSIGSSWTNTVQLTFAMLLLLVFPVLQKAFGDLGDPSDRPRQGLAALMLCFAAVACITCGLLARLLRPVE